MVSEKRIDEITKEVAASFQTFGGDRQPDQSNPLTHWLAGKPAQFALGVDVRLVVSCVLKLNARQSRRAKRKGKR